MMVLFKTKKHTNPTSIAEAERLKKNLKRREKNTNPNNKTEYAPQEAREKILEIINGNNFVTINELAEKTGLTAKGIEWQLRKMKSENLIHRVGPDKGGHWEVINQIN